MQLPNDRRVNVRFIRRSPFKQFPEFGCLDPDAWREPWEERIHPENLRKLRVKEDRATCATRASFFDLYRTMMWEVGELHQFAQGTSNDLRILEERLAALHGRPIPHLPPPANNDGLYDEWE